MYIQTGLSEFDSDHIIKAVVPAMPAVVFTDLNDKVDVERRQARVFAAIIDLVIKSRLAATTPCLEDLRLTMGDTPKTAPDLWDTVRTLDDAGFISMADTPKHQLFLPLAIEQLVIRCCTQLQAIKELKTPPAADGGFPADATQAELDKTNQKYEDDDRLSFIEWQAEQDALDASA